MEQQQQEYQDVLEMSPLVDSVVICSEMFGAESTVKGWFTSFDRFQDKQSHSFFKSRNRADVGTAYNTQFARDTQTEPYRAMSVGVAFIAPSPMGIGDWSPPQLRESILEPQPKLLAPEDFIYEESSLAYWWRTQLPQHCALTLKIGQDIRLEIPCLHAPPGYGVIGSGPIMDISGGAGLVGYNSVTQGVPEYENRFQFEKFLDIAKNAQIEAIVHLMEPAREYLSNSLGPGNYILAEGRETHPLRYMIQVSLYGVRYTQKRGEARK